MTSSELPSFSGRRVQHVDEGWTGTINRRDGGLAYVFRVQVDGKPGMTDVYGDKLRFID